jgi:hypothetical protein
MCRGEVTPRRRRSGDEFLWMARMVVQRYRRGESERTIARAVDASRGSVRHILLQWKEACAAIKGGFADVDQELLVSRWSAAPGPRPGVVGRGDWRGDIDVDVDEPSQFVGRNACGQLIAERLETDELIR